MVAPFPPEVVVGAADPAEAEASNLYAQFAWLARLADEMNTETELDLKRVMQIVLHARKFRHWYNLLLARGVPARDVIEGVFFFKKVKWATRAAMLQDLADIFTACGVIADWVEANAVEYKAGFARTIVTGMDVETSTPIVSDVPIKAVKTAAITTRISTFRALFGAKL